MRWLCSSVAWIFVAICLFSWTVRAGEMPEVAATSPDPFSACEAGLGTGASRYEGWRCFYMAARKGASWEQATKRVGAGAESGDAWAEVVLAHIHSDRGNSSAEGHYLRAIAAFGLESDGEGQAQARFGLANFRWNRGATPEEVQAILDQALLDSERAGMPILVATAKAQLARHLWRTGGDYDRAWALGGEAEAVAFPDGPYQLRLLVLHVLAGVAGLTARPEAELDLRQRMVSLAAGEGDAYVEATSRLNVAQHYLAEPDMAPVGAAEMQARLALSAATKAGNGYAVAGAHCTLGRALGPTHAEAGGYWQKCIDGYAAAGAPEAALYGMSGMATVRFLEDADEGIRLADAAAEAAKTGGQSDAALNARIVAAALRWQADRSDAKAATEEALLQADQTREQQKTESARAGVVAMSRLAHDLLATGLLGRGDQEGAFAAVERLRARELEEQLRRIGSDSPEAFAALGSLAAVRQELAVNEAFVAYQLPLPQTLVPEAVTHSWAFVVTREAVRVATLPTAAGLSAKLAVYDGLLRRRDVIAPMNDPVYAWIHPVSSALPADVERVFVVPDGPLHRAPLAGKFGAFEGDSRAVSTVASASVWLALRQEDPAPSGAVLAVADPVLPRAVGEANSAVARLGGRVVDVSESSGAGLIKRNLGAWKVIHFATHAVADVAHPERGEIRLPGGGRLRAAEIVDLGLRGQVIVLSACSGTDGRIVQGEGVLGLARAFIAGGARAVVGSRWPMRDAESAAFVEQFVEGLGRGLAVDTAVARAQDVLAAGGAPEGAWAGFMVVGDGSIVPFPGGVFRPEWWMVRLGLAGTIGVAVAIAGFGYFGRRVAARTTPNDGDTT